MRIKWILLAAGNSTRFGENKLLYRLDGKPMYQYALDAAIAASSETVTVVTQYDEICQAVLQEPRAICVKNLESQRGVSYSVQLGLLACGEGDGYGFLVCDQPYLTADTLVRMEACFLKGEKGIICTSDGVRRGNPVIFSAKYRNELLSLSGDTGGRQVVFKHPEDVAALPAAEKELLDLDYHPKD